MNDQTLSEQGNQEFLSLAKAVPPVLDPVRHALEAIEETPLS
jgi:hypothetical protein